MWEDITKCGMYKVQWIGNNDEVTKEYEEYLTIPRYRRLYLEMQTAYLKGDNVKCLKVIPIN